jgi:hypothetical protein
VSEGCSHDQQALPDLRCVLGEHGAVECSGAASEWPVAVNPDGPLVVVEVMPSLQAAVYRSNSSWPLEKCVN